MQSVKEPRGSTLPNSTLANAVRAQVERIVASGGFATSERHTRLLHHLVSMSLAGRGGEIKEYSLGVDLFGRGESFDPQTDAIVRTELSRLRAKLKAYYRADGRDDSLIIDLPNRSYVPVITHRETPAASATSVPVSSRSRWWSLTPALAMAGAVIIFASFRLGLVSATTRQSGANDDAISVAVLPFVTSDADSKLEQFADSLTDEVIETPGRDAGASCSFANIDSPIQGQQGRYRCHRSQAQRPIRIGRLGPAIW